MEVILIKLWWYGMVMIDNSYSKDISISSKIALTYSPYASKIYIGSISSSDFTRDRDLIR